jgi:hypothetical protein
VELNDDALALRRRRDDAALNLRLERASLSFALLTPEDIARAAGSKQLVDPVWSGLQRSTHWLMSRVIVNPRSWTLKLRLGSICRACGMAELEVRAIS